MSDGATISPTSLLQDLRRGAKWIIDPTAGLYRDDQPPEPTTA